VKERDKNRHKRSNGSYFFVYIVFLLQLFPPSHERKLSRSNLVVVGLPSSLKYFPFFPLQILSVVFSHVLFFVTIVILSTLSLPSSAISNFTAASFSNDVVLRNIFSLHHAMVYFISRSLAEDKCPHSEGQFLHEPAFIIWATL
jgi:hypothetical protein